jgi:type VI secretion system protein ImpF
MKVNQNQQNIQVSVLDRLIDNEPELSHESVQYRLTDFGRVKALVIRDLENLLNSKSIVSPPPLAYRELNKSLYLYGLRDFTSMNPRSPSVRLQLSQEIKNKIQQFEPRLKNVAVTIEAPAEGERTIRFKIAGLLILEPLAEPVTFDTYFDITKGDYRIPK